MTEVEISNLRKKRGSARGNITKTQSKFKAMSLLKTDQLCSKNIESILDSVEKQTSTYQHTHDGMIEKLELDGEDLSEREAKDLEEHEDLLQVAMTDLEELTASFTQLSLRARACNKLTLIHQLVEYVVIRPDQDGRKEAKVIDGHKLNYEHAMEEFGRTVYGDHHLKELAAEIGRKLHELTMELPETECPTPLASTHARMHDESGDRGRRYEPQQRQLPIIEIPPFTGNVLEWGKFWAIFKRNVHERTDLHDEEKLSYLQQAVQDKQQANLIDMVSGTYAECLASLNARYDRPRKIHQHYTKAFFTCKPCKNTSKQELARVHTTLANAVKHLEQTKQFTADAITSSFAEELLPPELWQQWNLKENDHHVVPSIKSLLTFLEERSNLTREGPIESPKPKRERDSHYERPRNERCQQDDRPRYERKVKSEYGNQGRVHQMSTGQSCTACKDGGHPIYECPVFNDMTIERRGDHVRKHKLCYNCLSRSHDARDCHSTYKCKRCGKAHHTTLHKEYSRRSAPASAEPEETRVVAAVGVRGPVKETQALIPTLQLTAQGPSGKKIDVRAMLDSGATISVIRTKLTNQLRLQHHHTNINITGVSNLAIGKPTALVTVKLSTRQLPKASLTMMAYALDKVAGVLPSQPVRQSWPFLDSLTLADPDFRIPKEVDLILGNDVIPDIIQAGLKVGVDTSPMATNTIFGWVVQGKVETQPMSNTLKTGPTSSQCYQFMARPSLAERLLAAQQEETEILCQFCKSEEVTVSKKELTPEEKTACESFDATHKLTQSGRFQVTLPRKEGNVKLGTSRTQAVRRFLQNEKALLKKGNWSAFQAVVQEYFSMDHAEPVDLINQQSGSENYYMPMHAVMKESSTSTKLRVVFDASASTSTGLSLNDTLVIGPTVHPSLCDILMRFRMQAIAITADISKMYRAIELAPDEKRYHRFVWREHPDGNIQDYQMTRVTFGVAASPFLATRALKQAATLAETLYPKAAEAVHTSFYVDDCITGAATIQEAIELRRELQTMLDPHDLVLRKWRSSSTQVMETIPKELHEKTNQQEAYGNQQYLKTLGIHWDAQGDDFYVSTTHLQLPKKPTKRLLTSDIHRTFDVLGWFTPVTLIMKVLVQELWEWKLDWDDVVPPAMQEEWTEWRTTLPELANRPVTRYYHRPDDTPCNLQLHGFSDASMKACSAVVYLRTEYDHGPPTVALVTAKSKLAPLKPMTVPRLELCGAHLLAQLVTNVRNALTIPPDNILCWTDSTIVLDWLDGSPRRYKTYVANRIVNTTDLVPSSKWRHVPTLENPADCASRGMMPRALIEHELWWKGPPWLKNTPIIEPPQPTRKPEGLELKAEATIHVTTVTEPWLVLDISTYQRLRRVVAWIKRFANNTQPHRNDRISGKTLTTNEIVEAEAVLHRQSQERTFRSSQPNQWKKNKDLQPFNPFKDPQGRLRVGGRLENATLTYDQIHPIILHGKDSLTQLIVRHQHITSGHAGATLVMANLGREYHLFQGMKTVKATCQNCVVCTRYRIKTKVQLMGQLPSHRVNPAPPFSIVGTDFAGPLLTKYAHVRRPTVLKTYVCLFCCMITKAVHLEPVTSLTTEAFLACLDRFISRRGKPTAIYSDNGSNFVGAANELERMFQFMRTEQLDTTMKDYCSSNRVEWHFSPERAPHHGGIWEAAVKSMKYHLRRIVGDVRLTYEELATVLYRIEAMLNSRPLTPLNSHSAEAIEVLTAGHFLIGRPLESYPAPRAPQTKSLQKRWALCQDLLQRFWDRWLTTYLQCLQRRNKWMHVTPNVKVNDIVLIREDGMFSHSWPKARVTKTIAGKDGLVRVAIVKTAKSTFKRPITKLSVLVSPDEEGEGRSTIR